ADCDLVRVSEAPAERELSRRGEAAAGLLEEGGDGAVAVAAVGAGDEVGAAVGVDVRSGERLQLLTDRGYHRRAEAAAGELRVDDERRRIPRLRHGRD